MHRTTRPRRRHARNSGVSIIEVMIAILVLSIGVVGIAQLYAVATMTSTLSVNTSAGIIDAQRCLEAMRGIAHSSPAGIKDPRLVSATFDARRGNCPTFVAATGFDSTQFRESVWVFGNTARVDGNGVDPPGTTTSGRAYSVDPLLPPGYDSPPLAPTATSLTVVVRLDPVASDRRFIQPIILSSVISHDY